VSTTHFDDDLPTLPLGHRFPGGTMRIAHWENWLLTDCTCREPMPDGLAHPIVLFHAPILGAGTSIGEIFAVCGTRGDSGQVGLVGYDWEYHRPLLEEVDHDVVGGIHDAVRRSVDTPDGPAVIDDISFRIEMSRDGQPVATVTNTWRIRRTSVGAARPEPSAPTARTGTPLPTWDVAAVDAARMKTMAAILRDPYPVHWDREANAALGLAGRVVNQGPLNLSYIANMLMAWAGPASIRRLTVRYGRPVLDGDHVVAGGQVRDMTDGVTHCDIWLSRGDEEVVSGTALVTAPT
jgi:acyl dehydratase